MQLKCIAIDDEPLSLALIQEYVSRFPALRLVQTFDDAVSAAGFLRQHPVDLLFVDINMPDINGIDLVRSLAEKPIVIFITAHRKFAVEGFELEALDYLLKPLSFERFSRTVQRALDHYRYRQQAAEPEDCLFVRSEYKLVKIALRDIIYIEGLQDYIKIHLAQGKPVMTLMTLKAMQEKLPPTQFRRIHRSYIIPVARVTAVVNRKVSLDNSLELPIGDSYAGFMDDWARR
ncbi:LytR/AlgR family response regulator transcription factor [Chitinophaga japonensis]|uniref:LytTR family two component transcriptional regulator n=1 Tax=Chitinophaga japonensis TaxID=104662 RepID=A0A562SMG5_CHIJA|nr:LytTR family DNA-binding domain-containing protein [Chitinophaga japonensis]TWI82495.1 LytTR family two component transcriptional regulator [Chitinophaga japonensis]